MEVAGGGCGTGLQRRRAGGRWRLGVVDERAARTGLRERCGGRSSTGARCRWRRGARGGGARCRWSRGARGGREVVVASGSESSTGGRRVRAPGGNLSRTAVPLGRRGGPPPPFLSLGNGSPVGTASITISLYTTQTPEWGSEKWMFGWREGMTRDCYWGRSP
jgi:hypothetical protein